MVKKKLDSYVGKLDCKQIVEGINVARRNALRLVRDAEILLADDRFASATSLAILSIEESGKDHILRGIATTSNDEKLKVLWRKYRKHTDKNILWAFPKLFIEGARKLDDFRGLFEPESEDAYILDMLKQISMYSDCLGKVNWSEPCNVIEKDIAIGLVEIANMFSKDIEMEEKEIESWVKHMKDVDDKSSREQKIALLHWFAEMHELGLRPKDENVVDVMKWLGLEFTK